MEDGIKKITIATAMAIANVFPQTNIPILKYSKRLKLVYAFDIIQTFLP